MGHRKKKILIVDDNTAIHNDFKNILEAKKSHPSQQLQQLENDLFGPAEVSLKQLQGAAVSASSNGHLHYHIDDAYQGEEAISMVDDAEKAGTPYSLIFMDVRMPPGMDGIQTIAKIWKNHPHVEIVICTAYSDYSWTDILDRFGSTHHLLFIKKPFNPITVKQLAASLTVKWQMARENERYVTHLEAEIAQRTQELAAAQEELLKKEKLAVLGRLTATISHELRNPFGVIRSSNFFLQRKIKPENDKIIKHFKRIDQQVTHCDAIVSELLEYTRGGAVTMVRQNITRWLTEVVDTQQDQKNAEIELDIAPGLAPLSFDPEKLRRVIINLITNAVQAVDTKINECKMRRLPFTPQIRLEVNAAGDDLRIVVRDNGVGMDQETQARAFEPLFTTRSQGTGIGLAIVKKVIEEHGGRIELKSRLDHGTKMSLLLPLAGQSHRRPEF